MYSMKRYTVAVVRERLSQALDEAERGEPVIIERKGVRYRLSLERQPTRRVKRRPKIEILDTAVEEGRWSWAMTGRGLVFKSAHRP